MPDAAALLETEIFRALRALADGRARDVAGLAQSLGCSGLHLETLLASMGSAFGLAVLSEEGRCRLSQPVDLIDGEVLRAQLAGGEPALQVEVIDQCGSTNTLLLERTAAGAVSGTAIVCEHQTRGRGRQGARWITSLGGSLAFSLLWRFPSGVHALSGLSLAIGVAVARALRSLGAEVQLKWPNDVLLGGRKLGGVLIEASKTAHGSAAVIGVGINVRLGDTPRASVDVPVADLAGIASLPARTVILARLLEHLRQVLVAFEARGFAPLRDEWQSFHAWQCRTVSLQDAGRRIAHGEALGVDDSGALLLRSSSGVERYHAGELSLRAGLAGVP